MAIRDSGVVPKATRVVGGSERKSHLQRTSLHVPQLLPILLPNECIYLCLHDMHLGSQVGSGFLMMHLYQFLKIEICAMVKRWQMWHGHPSHMGLPDQWLHHVTISNDIWWPSMNIAQHQQAIWPGFVSWSYLVSPCEDAAGLGGASSRGSEQCYSDLWQNMTLVPLNPLFDHPLPKTDRNENSDKTII